MLHDPRMAPVVVRGRDAARFLQAQTTNDVAALAPGGVALGAWCNPRGQVRNLFWTARLGEGSTFALVAPDGEAEGLVSGLRAFVLRSRVEVERSAESVLGVAGPEAQAHVAGTIGLVPAPGRVVEADGLTAFRPVGDPRRYLVLGPEPLPSGLPGDEWRRLEIEAGIAWLTEESRDSFIPQMLDLDRLGALSFDKGCFPGQEVIARTRYLGRLKRRLYRGRTTAGVRPAPGGPVQTGERTVGTIVAVESTAAQDGFDLLAVLRTESADASLETGDGRRIVVSSAG